MSRFPRRAVIAILAIFILAPATLAMLRQPFEGTRWKVTLTPDDQAHGAGAKEITDTLVFKGGKFSAESMTKRGFEPVEFQEELAPGGLAATFIAQAKSETEGTTRWRGTTTAGEMRGEMVWIKPDETEWNYTLQAERLPR